MATILVIDDSRLSRNIVEGILEKAGYTIVLAEDGKLGLEAFEQHRPDCVVTDLLMPVMDGHDFLRNLRAGGAKVPVIVASADIQETSRTACEEMGISGFLNKPIKAEQLVELVQKALAEGQEVATCN